MNPEGDGLVRAIDLALDGRWDEAHRIVQREETDPTAAWIHAVLHRMEGDRDNSSFWYRRAGRVERRDLPPSEELREIRARFAASDR